VYAKIKNVIDGHSHRHQLYAQALLLGIIIIDAICRVFRHTNSSTRSSRDDATLELDQEQTNSSDVESKEEQAAARATVGQTLDLSGSGLTSTPEYIFSRTTITQLDLSNNELEGSLPAEVRQLANLKMLDLSNNNFTGVPAEIGQLQKLEVLNLSNNQLTGLPYELGNLSKSPDA